MKKPVHSSEENKALSEKEFSEGRAGLSCLPQVLITFATDSCNLRCAGCNFGTKTGKKITISREGYQRVFDMFRYLDYVMITGAEMFFDAGNPEHYVERIFTEGLRHAHLRFVGVTNGTLITPERAQMITDKFKKIGISVDSPDPDVYKTVRIGSNLPLVSGNIRKISDLKSKRELGIADRPVIYLNFIIIERTYKDLLSMVKFARDVGAQVITLQAPLENSYTDENIFTDEAKTGEYIELCSAASEQAGAWGIRIQDRTRNTIMKNMPYFKNRLEFAENVVMDRWPDCCRLPWNELYINEIGDVTVCCTSRTVVGNINEQEIADIWNSAEMQALRKRIMKGTYAKDCMINCCRGYVLPSYYKQNRIRSLLTNVFTSHK
jgi:MoaA/NifB/PqqE/SkfB family radical SAM enzyme